MKHEKYRQNYIPENKKNNDLWIMALIALPQIIYIAYHFLYKIY